jgi:large subunit ribosomal protein L22
MANNTAQVNKPLVKASARSLRIAPRKMRLVTNLVKNMRLNDAITQLSFTNKKGAKMLQKLLQSAAANAETNHSLNRDGLFIKSITCNMGPVMQRSFPRARGSAFIVRRKLSHVNVLLEEREVPKKKKAVVTKAVAKPEKTSAEKIDEAEKKLDPIVEAVETPVIEEAPPIEVHHENEQTAVDEKTTPENLRK